VELEGLIPLIPSISRCGREKPNFIHTAYAPLFSLRLPEKFIPPSAEMKTVTLRFKIWFCGAGGIRTLVQRQRLRAFYMLSLSISFRIEAGQ